MVLLCLVLAWWTWVWFSPRAEASAVLVTEIAGPPDLAYNLFGAQAMPVSSISNPTGMAIQLLGSIVGTAEQKGYAVVMLEPRQVLAVQEGEEIVPGLRLVEVSVDQIIMERAGSRETLSWPKSRTPLAAPF